MPWKDRSTVESRVSFVSDFSTGLLTMSELCVKYGISRPTGYKWLGRSQAGQSLADRSRAPHGCPHRTAARLIALILGERRKHPAWGPDKIRHVLQKRHPSEAWPSATTMGNLFQRHGLSEPGRPRRRRADEAYRTPVTAQQANAVWTCDFKGEFRLGDRQLCFPLTVADMHSRFLLGCTGLTGTSTTLSQPVFARLFSEYGLPEMILSDNGTPFASSGFGGLSKLSVWWMRLGIVPMTIEPGKPQQNGRHERMHRTLKAATTRPPGDDLPDQQERFDGFVQEFNHERPHAGLSLDRPCDHYKPSPRSMPSTLPEPAYPGHYELRRVRSDGELKLKGKLWYLSTALSGQLVGLEEVDGDVWSVYLDRFLLARLDVKQGVVTAARRSLGCPTPVALRAPCAGQPNEREV